VSSSDNEQGTPSADPKAEASYAGDKPFKVYSSSPSDSQLRYGVDDNVAKAISEAQSLIGYAANAGIPISEDIADPIAQAREAQSNATWTPKIEAGLYSALSKLAAAVKPVTSEALAADWESKAQRAASNYFRWTVVLTIIIIPISVAMFINTSLSNEVEQLTIENDLAAVKIHDQALDYRSSASESSTPGRAPGVIPGAALTDLKTKLQQFARVSRQLLGRSELLNEFVLGMAADPYNAFWEKTPDLRRGALELDISKVETPQGLANEALEKLATYQDIRAFSKDAQQRNLVIYGAITTYLLPIAYSLLGACAFALRNLSAQTRARTYTPRSYANFARLIVALIAGTVIGLFSSFTQGVSVSPLGIAFLIGYSVEAFFSFLDGFVQTFQKGRGGAEDHQSEILASR